MGFIPKDSTLRPSVEGLPQQKGDVSRSFISQVDRVGSLEKPGPYLEACKEYCAVCEGEFPNAVQQSGTHLPGAKDAGRAAGQYLNVTTYR